MPLSSKLSSLATAVLITAAPATALAAPAQPPMNAFNSAYYVCDAGGRFSMSYDSTKPKSANMTTSNNSKTYKLKRTTSAPNVTFSNGAVTFATDGATVTVTGTEVALADCKLQSS